MVEVPKSHPLSPERGEEGPIASQVFVFADPRSRDIDIPPFHDSDAIVGKFETGRD
jgi:hypothetical protein